MNGVDVRVVKELLGHASIQTTMRYVHYVQTYATKSVRLAQKKERERWGHTTGPGGYKVDTAFLV